MNTFETLCQNFGIPTMIVATVITVISILIELIFKDKIPAVVKTFLPFVLGFLGATVSIFCLRENFDIFYVLSNGSVAGSLSLLIKGFIFSFMGKSGDKSAIYLCVKEVLNDYFNGDRLEKITKILSDYIKDFTNSGKNLSLYDGLLLKLKEFEGSIDDFSANSICLSIETAVNSLKLKTK